MPCTLHVLQSLCMLLTPLLLLPLLPLLATVAGGIQPDDVDGAQDGLAAAMACLANKQGAVEEVR